MSALIESGGRAATIRRTPVSRVVSVAARVLASAASSPVERTLAASALARASHRRGVTRTRRVPRAAAAPVAAASVVVGQADADRSGPAQGDLLRAPSGPSIGDGPSAG